MILMQRNLTSFSYCLFSDKQEIIDELGHSTGQFITVYGDAVQSRANISPATGQSSAEQFGNLENYDKVIVTSDMNCPIDENSVLFIDKSPEYASPITISGANNTTRSYSPPVYDYTVLRVAKSLNSVSIAVKKVKVS